MNGTQGSGARGDKVGGTVRTVRMVDDRLLRDVPHSGDAAGVGGWKRARRVQVLAISRR